MEVHKGKSRIAFVGKHFTCKIPNPNTLRQLSDIQEYVKQRDLKGLYKWFQYTENGFRWAISGVLQNWQEFKLSKELNGIVVPTRLSVFGIFNIQDTATDLPKNISNHILFVELGRAIGYDIMKDTHTFRNSDNFGIHNGQAKIRDYGDPKIGSILKDHFSKIKESLRSLISKPK